MEEWGVARRIHPKCVEIERLGGKYAGSREFTPMIPPHTTDSNLPFILVRYQVPLIPRFAMSINTCQGETLLMVGIYLSQSAFSHWQLYASLSRSSKKESVCAILPYKGGLPLTRNVAYRELLSN